MKKWIKILILLIIIQISYMLYITPNVSIAVFTPVDAGEQDGGNPPTVSGTIKKVTPIDSLDYTELQKTAGYILGFLQIASALTSVVMIAFTGFKLVMETNPTVLEETKKTMIPIVLGMVMTFGAVSIAKFIIGAVE